uniref:Uncharacterized protein n=1 Tax=Polytomella parva TaxID=51329 RepID=A0A7S0UMW2_9CHLO|mmetsp:Transcript_11261/g.20375  ORF Transcript_11261/g.20375 Transcript_11261/m.20375 type:complete len:112 (+) Transcript_11261:1647-1982(+)
MTIHSMTTAFIITTAFNTTFLYPLHKLFLLITLIVSLNSFSPPSLCLLICSKHHIKVQSRNDLEDISEMSYDPEIEFEMGREIELESEAMSVVCGFKSAFNLSSLQMQMLY